MGRVQGFNLRQYLSECEERDSVMPWAAGNDGYISGQGADAAAAIVPVAAPAGEEGWPRPRTSLTAAEAGPGCPCLFGSDSTTSHPRLSLPNTTQLQYA